MTDGRHLNESPNRPMVLPLGIAIVWLALGLFLFGAIGGLYGRFEEPIKENIAARVLDHPGVLNSVGAEQGATDPTADNEAKAATIAEDAWGRLKFFHGHGFSMVLASSLAFLLIANASMRQRSKVILTWIGIVSMTLYNVGWAVAGALVGWLSLDDAKAIGEYGFFIPFGVTTVVVWAIILWVWARELLGRGSSNLPTEGSEERNPQPIG